MTPLALIDDIPDDDGDTIRIEADSLAVYLTVTADPGEDDECGHCVALRGRQLDRFTRALDAARRRAKEAGEDA